MHQRWMTLEARSSPQAWRTGHAVAAAEVELAAEPAAAWRVSGVVEAATAVAVVAVVGDDIALPLLLPRVWFDSAPVEKLVVERYSRVWGVR